MEKLEVRKNCFYEGKMEKFVAVLPDGFVLKSVDEIAAAVLECGFEDYPKKLKVQPLHVDSGKVAYLLTGGPAVWREYDIEEARAFWDPYFKECLDGVSTLEDLVLAFYFIREHLMPGKLYAFAKKVGKTNEITEE